MRDQVRRLLLQGSAAGAELPASRPGRRAFLRANKLPQGGYVLVGFEMTEEVIAELEDRWERDEDFLDRREAIVEDVDDLDGVLRDWGLDPDVLVPAWKVDAP